MKDLTGQKFNRLTVIELAYVKNWIVYWLCECDCPKKTRKVIRAGSLTSGHAKGCGCLNHEPRIKDITGNKYGKLTVKHLHEIKKGSSHWICECECGRETKARGNLLAYGSIQTCGICSPRNGKPYHSYEKRILKKAQFPEYNVWSGMKARCCNTNNDAYDRYGGRGITVCEEWQNSFEQFYKDMGPRPTPNHTIERKNNNDGYNPDNCKWATPKEQCMNRRDSIYIEYKGIKKNLKEWTEELGLNYHYIHHKYKKANDKGCPLTPEELFTPPTKGKALFTINGKTQTLSEWSKESGIKLTTLLGRVERNWPHENLLDTVKPWGR